MINRVDMVVRNTRFQYPVSSEAMNDQLDEVYWNISELLGYQNVSGVVAVSGVIRELIATLEAERARGFGSAASGYNDSHALSSGYVDSLVCSGNLLTSELIGMWRSPW